MVSLRSIWVAVALSGLVSSCQKNEGLTLAEGQVIEMRTNKPVPFAWIEVNAQRGSGLQVGGYSPAPDPHQADAQGRFSFSFNAESGTTYILKAYSEAGHGSHWGEEPYLEKGRKNRDLRIPVAAPAWVKVRVEQKSTGQPDQIEIWGPWYDQGYISNIDLRPKDYHHISYHVLDSTMPTDNAVVTWEVNYGGQRTRFREAFSVQPFDTAEVVLRY
jgi:hypothetical protein